MITSFICEIILVFGKFQVNLNFHKRRIHLAIEKNDVLTAFSEYFNFRQCVYTHVLRLVFKSASHVAKIQKVKAYRGFSLKTSSHLPIDARAGDDSTPKHSADWSEQRFRDFPMSLLSLFV